MLNRETRTKLKTQTSGYLMAALGFVAGLAWNDAIKTLIESFFPFSKSGIIPKFIYALLVTVMVVILSKYLLPEEEDKK